MKILWLLVFILAFSTEVKVKASSTHGSAMASRFESHTASFETQKKVMSCPDSWVEDQKIIEGCHWVLGGDTAYLESVYGQIFARNPDFTIRKDKNKIFLVNHLGELSVKLKDGRDLKIPPGFEVWISELGVDKKNVIGILAPVDMKEHLELLSQVWQGPKAELKRKIELYKNRWGDRTEAASRFYQGLALRKMASVKAEEEAVQKKRADEKKRRESNRKLLFERAFGR